MPAQKAKKQPVRRYPPADVKLLFGFAAGRCAFPSCTAECCLPGTAADPPRVLGKIAHIVAHSDNGPRADKSVSLKDRDRYLNWVLLCPTHHDQVDIQPNTYTCADLRAWKEQHEQRVRELYAQLMPTVTCAELDVITKGIAGIPGTLADDFHVIPPKEKMVRNSLTPAVQQHLYLALGKAKEVAVFVEHFAQLDPDFPERLKAGVSVEYAHLKNDGYSGDALFEALVIYATQGRTDFRHQAAALAVVGYFFEACEVFER